MLLQCWQKYTKTTINIDRSGTLAEFWWPSALLASLGGAEKKQLTFIK
jgi:hypothetical protein